MRKIVKKAENGSAPKVMAKRVEYGNRSHAHFVNLTYGREYTVQGTHTGRIITTESAFDNGGKVKSIRCQFDNNDWTPWYEPKEFAEFMKVSHKSHAPLKGSRNLD